MKLPLLFEEEEANYLALGKIKKSPFRHFSRGKIRQGNNEIKKRTKTIRPHARKWNIVPLRLTWKK